MPTQPGSVPEIGSEPCDCEAGCCEAMWGEDDRGACVNRLPGGAVVRWCEVCGSHGWHNYVTGECLRCGKGEEE